MHQWDDTGIVMSLRRHGEQSAVIRVLTESHGLFPGMVKGAFSKKNRGVYQPGNRLHVQWQARLVEHLGQMRCELLSSCTAQLLADPLALKLMNAIGAMVIACVPERIPEKDIFNIISRISIDIQSKDEVDSGVLLSYVELEYTLLQALGFGLDLSACAATGGRNPEALIYVSPKSGRAVSREAGAPYKDKLLPLPAFMRDGVDENSHPDLRQMLDGLALTGYFLQGWLLHPEGKNLPTARQELVAFLENKADTSPECGAMN